MTTGWRAAAIGGAEIAAGHERNPQRREVAGLDDVPVGTRRSAVRPAASTPGTVSRRRRWPSKPPGTDAASVAACTTGQLAHAIDQLAREARSGRVGVAGQRQVERRELDAARIETGIGRTGPLQRPREQAGHDDEQDAERDLRDDERVPQPQPAGRPCESSLSAETRSAFEA